MRNRMNQFYEKLTTHLLHNITLTSINRCIVNRTTITYINRTPFRMGFFRMQ